LTIDWHGENAKAKRESAVRRATIRAFLIGAILAVIGIGGVVVYIQSRPVPTTVTLIVIATPAPTATSDPRTATAQEASARTAIAVALTSGAPTHTPTLAPTIAGDQPPSDLPDQLAAYRYDRRGSGAPRLTFQTWLPISARVGYHLSGARFDQRGRLYVAHARSAQLSSCNAPANADDAYWIIDLGQDPANAKIVGQLRSPMMVSPKRIAFDGQNNAYILAADCKQQTYAVFKFDARGQWVDTFPIIGGTDLAVTVDNRLLVAITGYADSTIPQAHLLELVSDPASGALKQIAQFDSGSPAGFYRALLADPTQAGTLSVLWVEPKVPERLSQLTFTPAQTTIMPGGTMSATIETSQGIAVPSLDNLTSQNGQVFGLGLTRRVIFQLAAGQITPIPFGKLYARTFAIGPDYWLLVGPPDALPTNAAH
jgi:hypothetical protein